MNFKPYGIPQGAPISDLLANLYLIDFDLTVKLMVADAGGAYFRYSDDILIAVPGGAEEGRKWLAVVQDLIRRHGEKLVIKEDKSHVYAFSLDGENQRFDRVLGDKGGNGLEYLGFRYDGRSVYLRDRTLAGLMRKITFAARRDAIKHAQRHPTKEAAELKTTFNYERLVKKFGKVEDFGEKQEDYRKWTFWTYARRAADIFGPLGKPILRQLRHHSSLVRAKARQEIDRAVIRRSRAAE